MYKAVLLAEAARLRFIQQVGNNGGRGPGQDERDGHARDAGLGGVERVHGTA
jgi:hypothetical protein